MTIYLTDIEIRRVGDLDTDIGQRENRHNHETHPGGEGVFQPVTQPDALAGIPAELPEDDALNGIREILGIGFQVGF